MVEKVQSVTKKNTARMVVMITTMMPVVIVSLRVGHTTFAVSARTCRMNSPGFALATGRLVLLICFGQPLGTGGPVSRKMPMDAKKGR